MGYSYIVVLEGFYKKLAAKKYNMEVHARDVSRLSAKWI